VVDATATGADRCRTSSRRRQSLPTSTHSRHRLHILVLARARARGIVPQGPHVAECGNRDVCGLPAASSFRSSGLSNGLLEIHSTRTHTGLELRSQPNCPNSGGSSRRLRSWRRVQRQPRQRLVRIRLRASVVAGREWLVHGFLSDLLKEQADEGLIVHGPVVLTVDEQAARSFPRGSAATRWSARPAPQEG